MKKHALVRLLLFLVLAPLWAAEGDADFYLEEIGEAVHQEYYPRALDLISQAQTLFPLDPRIPRLEGEIYYQQKLYHLSLKSLKAAEKLDPDSFETLTLLSQTQGRLNLNQESSRTLEKILELYPDSPEVIADLGWMYFKTFRPAEGERLLKEAVERYGETPGLLMTLGTLYTSLYDYPRGREYYLRSISAADERGWPYFSSVAYYNLALLDLSFYKYREAMEDAQKSMEIAPRFSGYICLGEIHLTRMDFHAALDAYTSAYNEDETPLSLISLADLYLHFGFLDAAKAHLDEAFSKNDPSWMFYFGVDPERHLMDIHEIYGDLYRSLSLRELRKPVSGWARLTALAKSVKYRTQSWIHRKTFQKYSIRTGKSYRDGGNNFDADVLFMDGAEDYPRIALKYLKRAEEFEIRVAPESYRHYRLKEGQIRKDSRLLREALDAFDPQWEKDSMDKALSALAPLLKKGEKRSEVVNLLYRINPGAFIRESLSLPVNVQGKISSRLRKYLIRGGIEIAGENAGYALSLETRPDGAFYSFRDLREGRVLWSERADDTDGRLTDETLAGEIISRIFSVR